MRQPESTFCHAFIVVTNALSTCAVDTCRICTYLVSGVTNSSIVVFKGQLPSCNGFICRLKYAVIDLTPAGSIGGAPANRCGIAACCAVHWQVRAVNTGFARQSMLAVPGQCHA